MGKFLDLTDTVATAGYAHVLVRLSADHALRAPAPVARALSKAAAAKRSSFEACFVLPPQAVAQTRAARGLAPSRLEAARKSAPARVRVFPNLGVALGYVDGAGLKALAARDDVEQVTPAPALRLIRPVARAESGQPEAVTWGLRRLKAEPLWAAGLTGASVVVGHLDTGVDASHPALVGAIDEFVEFDLRGDRVPGAPARDSGEHGTHTAGVILGRRTEKGAFGMAPDAKLASALVIEGGDAIARVLGALEWVIDKKLRILSMSLGVPGFAPDFQAIVDSLRDHDVLPVFASGNEGVDTSRSPGNYANVLSVGAIGPDDAVAFFSGSQAFDRAANPLIPDLVAPGVDTLSCIPNNGYATLSGTSVAAPHIAGLAALLLQARPAASAAELESAIRQSCARSPNEPQERANLGVPDGPLALRIVTGQELVANAPAPTGAAGAPVVAAAQ